MKPDKNQLEEYYAYFESDTEFSAKARLLQSKWRVNKGYEKHKEKLGNYLESDFAKTNKNNFLTDKIRTLVQYEIYASHQKSKLIAEPRIWENLLSSQPLTFNLFGELHFDLNLATSFFKKLYPESITEVTQILFEHSPGRGDLNFTGDHSAFDVFIEFLGKEKQKGFIGIEVKYAESMADSEENCKKIFKKHSTEYTQLSIKHEIFRNGAIDYLKHSPLQQVWRDHLLAIATLNDYAVGFFVFLYPRDNSQCEKVVNEYQRHLILDQRKCPFVPEKLETYITALAKCSKADWINELKTRYLFE